MFPWETETTQQARAVAAAPSGPENNGNVPCSPNVSFADILGGGVKHVPANELESLQAHQATRRAQREAQQAQARSRQHGAQLQQAALARVRERRRQMAEQRSHEEVQGELATLAREGKQAEASRPRRA